MTGAVSAPLDGEVPSPAARTRLQLGVLQLSGFAQGTTVVMLPSLGNVLRDPAAHGLSDAEYGRLFLPFIVAAIVAGSGFGAVSRRLGTQRALLLGLGANGTSMLLLAATAARLHAPRTDRMLLGLASLCLGVGFGLALSGLNTLVARLEPRRPDAAVTNLHALVGVGTVVPALLLPFCMGAVGWWLLPLLSATLLAALVVLAWVLLPPSIGALPSAAASAQAGAGADPAWRGFLVAAVLYGACEALIGNWGTVYLHGARGLAGNDAGRALSAFWAAVTVGRALAVVVARRVSPSRIHVALPALLALALVVVALLPRGATLASVAAFALAGLGCSAILPLTISRAVQSVPARAEQLAGLLLAAFLAGQGSANLVVGWAAGSLGIGLSPIFLAAAVPALGASLLAATLGRAPDEVRDEP